MNTPPSCWRPIAPSDADFLRDESRRTGTAASIAFPATEAELAACLAHARAEHIPLTIQGARTGITGGAVPDGGAILNLSRMKRIALASPDPATGAPRLYAEPGATLAEIRAACPPGWFFSPDPTETTASIGGMFSCNASGALSYLYGPVRPSVAAARILLEDGTLLDLVRGRDRLRGLRLDLPGNRTLDLPSLPPRPAVKNAAGYYLEPDMDALDLFIGAEGTLGILTGAILLLRPAPAERWALLAFPNGSAAAAAAVQALRRAFRDPSAPAPLAALEYFDPRALDFLRARTDDPVARHAPPSRAALYAEFHAPSPDAAEAALLLAADTLASAGTDPDTALTADTPSALARFKTFRHALPESVNALIGERRRAHPSIVKLGSDMSVPDDRLEDVLRLYTTALDASSLDYVIFGHIGDNHLHVNILPRDDADMAAGRALYRDFASRIVAWGGSLSAEHGIGKSKTDLLRQMYPPSALASMSRIRTLLSPLHLLNPSNLGL
jgi:D-lactate dehydrogenase (cytochrome)